MLKFNHDTRRVTVDPKTVIIQNLGIIWDNDSSKGKEKSTKLLTYIHLVSQIDEEAPYYTSAYNEVGPLAKRDLYGNYEHDFTKEYGDDFDDFLEESIAQYQQAYETVDHRSYRSIIRKIDQTRELIDSTDPQLKESIVRGAVTYASNFAILNKMIQELGPLQDAADEMRARMKKAKAKEEGVMRAGKKRSIMEERLRKAKEKNEAGSFSNSAGF